MKSRLLVLAATLLGLLVHLPMAVADVDASPGVRGSGAKDGDDVDAQIESSVEVGSCCQVSLTGTTSCETTTAFVGIPFETACNGKKFLLPGVKDSAYTGPGNNTCVLHVNCNLPPVANDDTASTFVDVPHVFISVLSNDDDPVGFDITIKSAICGTRYQVSDTYCTYCTCCTYCTHCHSVHTVHRYILYIRSYIHTFIRTYCTYRTMRRAYSTYGVVLYILYTYCA